MSQTSKHFTYSIILPKTPHQAKKKTRWKQNTSIDHSPKPDSINIVTEGGKFLAVTFALSSISHSHGSYKVEPVTSATKTPSLSQVSPQVLVHISVGTNHFREIPKSSKYLCTLPSRHKCRHMNNNGSSTLEYTLPVAFTFKPRVNLSTSYFGFVKKSLQNPIPPSPSPGTCERSTVREK